MRKIFTFLLALVASVGMMNAKVTWNSSNISDLQVYGTYQSYSKEGVSLRANADMIDAWWSGYGDESHDGISFNAHATGGYTFSNTLGKNFTKIEMTLTGPGGWDMANLGSGWSFYWDYMNDLTTVTWTGNASTVDLLKDESDFGGTSVKSIVFYFVGDSEAPDPTYTIALQDGTANADKVTLSATSAVEGATITVTPDEEYEITAFKATYNTTEEAASTLDPGTGAYSFTMPAYAVTIEATIALKPVPEGDIFAGFTATAGSGGFNNEGHAKLVDNKYISSNWTKWCAGNEHKSVPTGESGDACWWIDFEASAAIDLTGYILTTGNDTGSEHGRNPKNWLLKAKLNADDAWTTIATVTNDVTMKNKSFKDYKFFVDQSGSYQYFRFEVFANQGANVMQLCELRLIGTEPTPVADLSKDIAIDLRDGQLGSDNNGSKYLIIDSENNYTYLDAEPASYNVFFEFANFNGAQHGYTNLKAAVPVEAGNYKLTLGACGYGNGSGTVKNEDLSETLASFNQQIEANTKCYHQNTAENIVTATFSVTADQTIHITCGNYTPYFKLEKLEAQEFTVTFAAEDAEGSIPAARNIVEGESLTIPANQTLYKEGYTLTGWSDGENTYAAGASYSPTANVMLTAVFTANVKALLTAQTETSVKWIFGESNGAPSMHLEGGAGHGFLVAQATVDGESLDVKLAIDATSGKFNNSGRADKWAQVNANTTFSFPSKQDIAVAIEAYSGAAAYSLSEGILTVTTNDYFSYLQVTYPASQATGVDNAKADGKVVKLIRNGQLLIIRDGKTYNVVGTIVR